MSIEQIKNSSLLEAYNKAIEKQLNDDFIFLLRNELFRRGFELGEES